MNEQAKRNKERADRIRGRKLLQITKLKEGKVKKHLEGETRLRAALLIRERYEALLKPRGPFTMGEIIEHLEGFNGIPDGLKIHRWMLKAGEVEITPELKEAYRDRAEPQKKTRMYLNLVAALANLAGEDQDDAMIAFMDQTGLSDRMAGQVMDKSDDDIDPRFKLADLVRHYAAHIAAKYDLAALFEKSERLQSGWNPNLGEQAILLRYASQQLTPATVLSGTWFADELPPLPSVPLALIPFAHLSDARFILGLADGLTAKTDKVTQGDEHKVAGSATAYWSLHLAIAPQPGGGVQPCLLRTCRVQVALDLEQNGDCVQSTFDLSNADDDLEELHDQGRRRGFIELDGRRSVIFDRETSSRLQASQEKGDVYRVPRRNDETDECPPSITLPFARITPVTPQSIQDWLIDDLDFLGAVPLCDPALADFEHETLGLETWFVTPSRARLLEIAIRANLLEDGFMKWIVSYRNSLEELERERLEEMTVADLALRKRWQAERDGPHAASE